MYVKDDLTTKWLWNHQDGSTVLQLENCQEYSMVFQLVYTLCYASASGHCELSQNVQLWKNWDISLCLVQILSF